MASAEVNTSDTRIGENWTKELILQNLRFVTRAYHQVLRERISLDHQKSDLEDIVSVLEARVDRLEAELKEYKEKEESHLMVFKENLDYFYDTVYYRRKEEIETSQ